MLPVSSLHPSRQPLAITVNATPTTIRYAHLAWNRHGQRRALVAVRLLALFVSQPLPQSWGAMLRNAIGDAPPLKRHKGRAYE
ncbi:hypothetical protein [Enterovibrio norvegicus]|uniref:hypothetical protein n=1 Tax=Enterovibrio norvegicus TaxID=188144 RepID=UPI0015E3A46F|nr:hypothetical protein [Enterovibrio norvegicus]